MLFHGGTHMNPGTFFDLPKLLRRTHDKKKNLVILKDKKSKSAEYDGYFITGELHQGNETRYAVGHQDIVVDDSTWVFGELKIGSIVRVSGEHRGTWVYAKRIMIKG